MKIIAIEGIDGSGKGTQSKLLYERLKSEYDDIHLLSFPKYDEPQSILVRMYLEGKISSQDPEVISTFYALDRYTTLQKRHFSDNSIIICDRYSLSNVIHQLTKHKYTDWKNMCDVIKDIEYNKLGNPYPIVNIYLDMHPEVSYELITKRYDSDMSKADIHEKMSHLIQCYKIIELYKNNDEIAKYCLGENFELVSCTDNNKLLSIEDISDIIYNTAVKYIK